MTQKEMNNPLLKPNRYVFAMENEVHIVGMKKEIPNSPPNSPRKDIKIGVHKQINATHPILVFLNRLQLVTSISSIDISNLAPGDEPSIKARAARQDPEKCCTRRNSWFNLKPSCIFTTAMLLKV